MKKYLLIVLLISLCEISVAQVDSLSEQESYNLGKQEAQTNYKASEEAKASTLLSAIISPWFGLIPAILNQKIRHRDLDVIKKDLAENKHYYSGYKDAAAKIKRNSVWKNFFIGLGINVTIKLILGIALINALFIQ